MVERHARISYIKYQLLFKIKVSCALNLGCSVQYFLCNGVKLFDCLGL